MMSLLRGASPACAAPAGMSMLYHCPGMARAWCNPVTFEELRTIRGQQHNHMRSSLATGGYNQHPGAKRWRLMGKGQGKPRRGKLAIKFSKDGRFAIVPNINKPGAYREAFPMLSKNHELPLPDSRFKKIPTNHVCVLTYPVKFRTEYQIIWKWCGAHRLRKGHNMLAQNVTMKVPNSHADDEPQVMDLHAVAAAALQQAHPAVYRKHRKLLGHPRARKGEPLQVFNKVNMQGGRCAAHHDKGDAKDSLTVMHVVGPNPEVSNHVLFPQGKIAVRAYPGDTVIFNAREVVHANSELEGVYIDPVHYANVWDTRERNRMSLAYNINLSKKNPPKKAKAKK